MSRTVSLLYPFQIANNAKLSDYRPLTINGEKVGLIHQHHLTTLRHYGLQLIDKADGSLAWQAIGDCAANTTYLATITQKMATDGFITGWRNEQYAIATSAHAAPYALIERAAIPVFGSTGYGVHINGLVRKKDGIYMWIGQRSPHKQTSPNQFDQIAAGGQPYGISPFANLQKECAEEAAIPYELSATAQAVGISSYYHEVHNGIRADVMYHYDLWLPEHFTPHNTDGEVASFHLKPLTTIIDELRDTTTQQHYKYNSAIVIIDCAIRHGILTPDNEPDYLTLCHALTTPRL